MSHSHLACPLNVAYGVCPGHHESAGKRKSGKTRHGDRWPAGALGTAAMAAARTKGDTYLGARFCRLAPRLGKKKAIVAIEHSILIAIWHMLTNDVDYHDLGGDYFGCQPGWCSGFCSGGELGIHWPFISKHLPYWVPVLLAPTHQP